MVFNLIFFNHNSYITTSVNTMLASINVNILDTLNIIDFLNDLVNKDLINIKDLIMATVLLSSNVKEYKINDLEHPNNKIFLIIKYNYVDNVKNNVSVEFYSAYVDDKLLQTRLIKRKEYVIENNDTIDYSKYYKYIQDNYFNRDTIIYEGINFDEKQNKVFTVIYDAKESSESNKNIVIDEYLITESGLVNINVQEFLEDIPIDYSKIITKLKELPNNIFMTIQRMYRLDKDFVNARNPENIQYPDFDKNMYIDVLGITFDCKLTVRMIEVDKTTYEIIQY